MKINVFLATAAAIATLSVTAHAADTTYYDPAPQPQYDATQAQAQANWQGAYAGVQLGGGRANVSGVGDDRAIVGGGHAGYLMQRGSFVAGPEIDADLTGWSVGGTDINPAVHAKIRAGIAVDNFLVTGSVGYGHMWTDGANDGGLTLGAGADMAITDRIVGGAEYLYTDADSFGGGANDVSTHTIRSRLSYKFN